MNGIQIFEHGFKISHFADDTSLYRQPDEESLYVCMKLLVIFGLVSGLTINREKRKGIKSGA